MHWMTAGCEPGFEVSEHGKIPGSWKINRPAGQAWPKYGWGTDFSAFRIAVPESAGFDGRAIYMDADMLVLGDVRELAETPLRKPWKSISSLRTDVSVIDCAYFKDKPWWPTLNWMRPSGSHLPQYREILKRNDCFDTSLPPEWNWCDDQPRSLKGAKLLHYTNVPLQPYHPYPSVQYQPHHSPAWVDIWNQYEQESRAALHA